MRIGIVGGTGKQGTGLGLRWASAGHEVVIGSRQIDRAKKAAAEISRLARADGAQGVSYRDAAAAADVVVISVPYAAHAEALQEIRDAVQGKIVIDVCVPLDPNDATQITPPSAGSAVEEAQQILGSGTPVVGAFQNIPSKLLQEYDKRADADVFVCGDSADARQTTLQLVRDAGLRGWDTGPASQARNIERITALLIGLNKRYRSRTAAMRIANLDPQSPVV